MARAPRAARRANAHLSAVDAADWALATIPVLVVFLQLVLLGANSGVLSAAAALLDVLAVAAMAGLAVRTRSVFDALLPVLLLVAGAVVWGFVIKPFSIVPSATPLEAAKLIGVLALLICGALAGARRARAKLFCGVLAVVGGLYAIGAFWLYEADPFRVFGVVKVTHAWRFTGTMMNANAAGAVFGMIGLAALGWVQSQFAQARSSERHRALIAMGLASVSIALIACGFTGSRMAFLWTVLFGAVLCVVDLFRGRSSSSSRERGRTPRLIAAIAVLALIVLVVGLGVGKVLIREESAIDTYVGRLQIIERFTRLALQRPLTGWGLGAFDLVNQSTLSAGSAVDMYDFGAAHSSLVQVFLEGGLPYLLLLGAAGVVIVSVIVRTWRQMADGWSRGLVAAVALAMACSLDDIDLNVPALAALAALMLGVLWGRGSVLQQRTGKEAAL